MYKVVCTFKLFEFTRNRIFVLKWAELKRVWWGGVTVCGCNLIGINMNI